MNKFIIVIATLLLINSVITESKRIDTYVKLSNMTPETSAKLQTYINGFNLREYYSISMKLRGYAYGQLLQFYEYGLYSIKEKMEYLNKLDNISIELEVDIETNNFNKKHQINFKNLIETYDNECGFILCNKSMKLSYRDGNYLFNKFELVSKTDILSYMTKLIEDPSNVIF